MVALGDGLGCYRVGILLNIGSGNWAGLDLEAHGNSCYEACQFQRFLSYDFGTCDLGIGLHMKYKDQF